MCAIIITIACTKGLNLTVCFLHHRYSQHLHHQSCRPLSISQSENTPHPFLLQAGLSSAEAAPQLTAVCRAGLPRWMAQQQLVQLALASWQNPVLWHTGFILKYIFSYIISSAIAVRQTYTALTSSLFSWARESSTVFEESPSFCSYKRIFPWSSCNIFL